MPNLWQEFKAEYPAGKGADADYTWQIWRNLMPDEKQAAVDGLRRWKDSGQWKDRRYIPSAGNFLTREKWKEIPEDQKAQPKPWKPTALNPHPPSFDSDLYRQKAQDPKNYIYRKRGAACST